MEPAWASLRDDELLKLRLCDLHLRIADSEMEPQIGQLYEELRSRGLGLLPGCYIGDEWFSPEGSPLIAIPFYLVHPRLKQLELHQMLEVEGGDPEWCQQLLRHECGHAYEHAYRFTERERWAEVFGDRGLDYQPDTYTPQSYSKSFVRHLPNWYAQSHPDEDFAETFAVWLASPEEQWRSEYRRWRAIEKLEYVDSLMKEVCGKPPLVYKSRHLWDATRSRKTLEKYYASKRKLYAEDFPDVYDVDLRAIFGMGDNGAESAAQVMRRFQKPLVSSVVRWTGQRKYIVDMLVRKLAVRVRELALRAPQDDTKLMLELSSYLAALVTNHLHTGRFKRSV